MTVNRLPILNGSDKLPEKFLPESATFTGTFGLGNATPNPRIPFGTSYTINAQTPGETDKIGHVLSTKFEGDFSTSTGTNASYGFGLNAFTTTGENPGDGQGAKIQNIAEVAVKSPAGTTVESVIGLNVDAAFFGPGSRGHVNQIEALRVSHPRRKDGATEGTATTIYGLLVEAVNAVDLDATVAFSLYVAGGISRFQGRVDIKDRLVATNDYLSLEGGFTNTASIKINSNTNKGVEIKLNGDTHTERLSVLNQSSQTCLFISGSGTLGLSKATLRTTQAQVAGTAPVLPANPVGYLTIELNGVTRSIPYYGWA